eukprot:TRINITY_DN9805_c0_g2_i1.p1 TRINITY_DN9805_c0_g2~~TRINITY_DN9805_c0_g2_i1.p1  ORF type:complete len:222 (-),score=28.50 TRINITY_DN9805_c0_g2_i1:184-849(-)
MTDYDDIVPVATKATMVSTSCTQCSLVQDVYITLQIDVKGGGTGSYNCANPRCGTRNRIVLDKRTIDQLISTSRMPPPAEGEEIAPPSGGYSQKSGSIPAPAESRNSRPNPAPHPAAMPNLPAEAKVRITTDCSQCRYKHTLVFKMKIDKTNGTGEIKYECSNCRSPNKAVLPPETVDKLLRENRVPPPAYKICICCCCVLCWTLGGFCGCTEMGTLPPCV